MKKTFNINEVATVIAKQSDPQLRASLIHEFSKLGAERSKLIEEVNKHVTQAFKER